MPPVNYSLNDLLSTYKVGRWQKIKDFDNNFNQFVEFVGDQRSEDLIGSYARAQLMAILPEIKALETKIQTTGIAGSDNEYFIICKTAGDSWLVWSIEKKESDPQRPLDGKDCLKKLASLASAGHVAVRLRFAEQKDAAYMWKASSVHPLQVLENAYQRVVRQAGAEQGVDPVKAQTETLSRFFIQDVGSPQFYTKNRPDFSEDQTHLAAVKMNHLIESFYLFRLLVQYQVESSAEVSDELRVGLSSDLTKLLHNGNHDQMGWISEWLTKKIAELGAQVTALNCSGKTRVIFFLKGGRALNYFLGTPGKGENDWDTQIVIDPTLPAEEWYQCFGEVHDIVLNALEAFKSEFSELVEKNADKFSAYLESVGGVVSGHDDDEAVDENEMSDVASRGVRANCKAELIDVGLPRRDSASALEEWTRLSAPDALKQSADGIFFPHRNYYLNEYMMMVRDAFLPNADVRKAPKRISRFRLILESGDGGEAFPVEAMRLEALPKSTQLIAALDAKERRNLYEIMTADFIEAYNFNQDRELAAIFDDLYAARIANPPELPAGLVGLLDAQQRQIATDVGVAHAMSEIMIQHWQSRNAFFQEQRPFFMDFLQQLSRRANIDLHGVWAQFAIAGSFAGRLHADHLRVAPDGLEPIRRILIKLQCERGSDPNEVLNLVQDSVTELVKATGRLKAANVKSGDKQSIILYWSEPVTIGDFRYAPLVMKIRGAEQSGKQLPVLASIEDVPVVDLRYLAADYLRKTSKIDERGSRHVLSAATSAISEMLSRFDFESDDAE